MQSGGELMTNKYLQNFRQSKNLSTEEIATKIGASTSLYEKVEFGRRNPSYGFVSKLKNAFPEVDIDKIYENTPQTQEVASTT